MPGSERAGATTRSDTEVVILEIPPGGDLLSLARLTAATLAARADFTVEEVEDLRLAVDELCLPLVRGSGSSRLQLQFAREDDAVTITCTPVARAVDDGKVGGADAPSDDDGREPHPDDALSGYILDALVDEHGPVDDDRQLAGHWLRKRRAS
jgi:anti-sigma regulatory factor (Ser/Thr protein kinase)